ncbi:hypothetical protein [Halomonas rhizosphaerae]|uniref:Uncharacterized protein n=1 Tax=Halomonas rhizosphaerae TaxID=3043296 RepID=A0ABT6V0E5_9GAMM|nr:hypothetical protein [Halomonas rhizosphaerae]MDI5891706.1 hypothetical protein [Halomonas rhizosphaerae]MDI5920730.1 hypothetical protein [Halomonas rhizosphaerae]
MHPRTATGENLFSHQAVRNLLRYSGFADAMPRESGQVALSQVPGIGF